MIDKEKFQIALGSVIRNLREELNMTQDELAGKCGYTSENKRSTINKIESGKSDLPATKIVAIAKALNINPAELLFMAERKTEQ